MQEYSEIFTVLAHAGGNVFCKKATTEERFPGETLIDPDIVHLSGPFSGDM